MDILEGSKALPYQKSTLTFQHLGSDIYYNMHLTCKRLASQGKDVAW